MPPMDWKLTIDHWRSLPLATKARIRRDRIPLNVAESMTFEGEPVDLEAMKVELSRLDMIPATSKPASGS